jgi:hypothetical protein
MPETGAMFTKIQRYTMLSGCTDVANIISAANTALVACGWTDTSGVGTGPWRTPVNGLDGRYLEITLSRISATRLKAYFYDKGAGTYLINNQTSSTIDIDAGGTNDYIHMSPDLFWIETARATPETMFCFRVELWPESSDSIFQPFICSNGPRGDTGTLSGNANYLGSWFARDSGDSSYSTSTRAQSIYKQSMYQYQSNCPLFSPIMICKYFSPYTYWGHFPCVMWAPDSYAYGQIVTAPMGPGVTGSFRATNIKTSNTGYLRVFTRAENVNP